MHQRILIHRPDWLASTILEKLRPVTDNLDFVSILQKVTDNLRDVNPNTILFARGDGSDCLVAWLVEEEGTEEKIWVRVNGEVWLCEERLEFRCEFSKVIEELVVFACPDQSTNSMIPPSTWFKLDEDTFPEYVDAAGYTTLLSKHIQAGW